MPLDGTGHPEGIRDVIDALDAIEAFLDGGKRWTRGMMSHAGGYCLLGAAVAVIDQQMLRMQVIKCVARVAYPDSRSFAVGSPVMVRLVAGLNDGCKNFRAVRKCLARAREVARADITPAKRNA